MLQKGRGLGPSFFALRSFVVWLGFLATSPERMAKALAAIAKRASFAVIC